MSIFASPLSGTAVTATVATAQTTTSATYTDLATTGPSVTVNIGNSGLALVCIKANMQNNTANSFAFASFAISGASTVASADVNCISLGLVTINNSPFDIGGAILITGLATGSTTFKMQYKAAPAATTATFTNRTISVIPL